METTTQAGAATATAYPDHPYASIFPMITEGEDYTAFREDLRVFGQKEEVVLHDGKVLDGRNRQKALLEIGVAPNYRTFIPAVEGDPLEFVLSKNLVRRHLTQGQKAAIATDFEQVFAEEAKARRAKIDAANKQGKGTGYDEEEHEEGAGQPGPGDSTIDRTGEFDQTNGKGAGSAAGKNGSKPKPLGASRTRAGKLLGVGEKAVQDAKKLKTNDPKAFEQVKQGATSLNSAVTGRGSTGSKKAEEYDAALKKIEDTCGKGLATAIREGSRLKNRKDVIAYADLPDTKMVDIRHLIEHNWPLKKALLYKAEDLQATHRIIDGITRAAASGEKSFSQVIETPEMGCDWEVTFKPKPRPTFEQKVSAAKVGDVIEGAPAGKTTKPAGKAFSGVKKAAPKKAPAVKKAPAKKKAASVKKPGAKKGTGSGRRGFIKG